MPKQDRRVNINRASATDLQRIDGIDRERARLIIEYREAHGPFRNWEDLGAVAGVGEALIEKLQAGGSFDSEEGSTNGAQQFEASRGADESELDEETDEEVEALAALARMDLEAAEAYDIASEAIDDPTIVRTLQDFRDDHARHFENINQIIVQRGFEPVEPSVDPEESMFLALVDTSVALGPLAALLSLISSEQLTNSTYESAMMLGFDEDVMSVLERANEDEKRHLSTLQGFREKGVFKAEEPPLTEAQPPA